MFARGLTDDDCRFVERRARAWCRGHGVTPDEADDIVQEALLASLDAARRFEPGRGVPWPSYLARCARQLACEALRRHIGRTLLGRRKRILEGAASLDAPAPSAGEGSAPLGAFIRGPNGDPLPKLVAKDTKRVLLGRLTGRRREIVELRLAGLTYAEIGERLGVTKGRVAQLFTEIRRRLAG